MKYLMGEQSETLARPKNDSPTLSTEGSSCVRLASFGNRRLASQSSLNVSESSPHLAEPSQLERFEDHPQLTFISRCAANLL